jgi:hypothetical protein
MGASSPAGLLNPFQGPNGEWYEGDKLGMGAANAVLDAHLKRLKEEHEEARARRIAAEARRDNVLKLAAIIDEWEARYKKLGAQYDRLSDQHDAWREVAIAEIEKARGYPVPPLGDPRRGEDPLIKRVTAVRDRKFAARLAGNPEPD